MSSTTATISTSCVDTSRTPPRWARFGRGDVEEDDVSATESGWFRAWLARQNHHWVMSGQYPYLVETDVANFFPYVDLNSIMQHVLSHSELSEDSVRLLAHMLRAMSPMRTYRMTRAGGLPQEPLDSSRILAHAYLREVDEAMEPEGSQERYTRWVDDILIGANSQDEALQQVRRVQLALEHLGLYPNAAKTRIIAASTFTHDYMKNENDYLGDVDDDVSAGKVDRVRFRQRLHNHLLLSPRPKAWGRVLRRYYSISRAIGERHLLTWWQRHLSEAPDSLAQILEYVATFRLSAGRLNALEASLTAFGDVYEDVELLARECVAVAPNVANGRLADRIADWGLSTVDERLLTMPRLASAGALLVGKFGSSAALDKLADIFRRRMVKDSVVRQQAAVVLFATGRLSEDELLALGVGSSSETVSQIRFLMGLARGERTAVGIALGIAEPISRQRPARAVIRPRALFLVPLIRRGDPVRWKRIGPVWLSKIQRNERRLRDAATERWVRESLR